MATKKVLTKKEQDQVEHGVQKLLDDPMTPVNNQLWLDKSTGKLKFYNGVVNEIFESYVEGSAPYTIANIAALDIDWSVTKVYRKTGLTGTNNFTFSNLVDGKSIFVILLSSSIASSTVGFPVGTKLVSSDDYDLASGQGIVVKLTRVNGVTYAEQLFKATLAAWPSGAQGNLTVLNGQTVNVNNGDILDYNNVDVQAGGVLNVNNSSGGWLLLGVAGNLTIDGEVRSNSGLHNTATFNITTPTDESISYSSTQRLAGAGGRSGFNSGNPIPSQQPSRWGAGGGAGTVGLGGGGGGGPGPRAIPDAQAPSFEPPVGGNGAANGGTGAQGGGDNGVGGPGQATLGNGGNSAQRAAPGPSTGTPGGQGGGSGGGGGGGRFNPGSNGSATGGGGGGYKGRHGSGLYIYCLGDVSGSGLINASGRNGFNGGSAGQITGTRTVGQNGNGAGGAGGGGGAGAAGNGGRIVLRHGGSFSGVATSVVGGTGGSGGARGTQPGIQPGPGGPGPARDASVAGQAGQPGNAGSTDIAPI